MKISLKRKDWFNSFVMSFERSIGLCQQKKVGGAKKYYFAKLLNSNFFLRMEAYQKTWVRSTGLGGRGVIDTFVSKFTFDFFITKNKGFSQMFCSLFNGTVSTPFWASKKVGGGGGGREGA